MISAPAVSTPKGSEADSGRAWAPWWPIGPVACGYTFGIPELNAVFPSSLAATSAARLDNQHHCNYGPQLITRYGRSQSRRLSTDHERQLSCGRRTRPLRAAARAFWGGKSPKRASELDFCRRDQTAGGRLNRKKPQAPIAALGRRSGVEG